jgi:hypothetical protein
MNLSEVIMGKKLNQMRVVKSGYADVVVHASWSGDCVHGEKGRAKAKSGAKSHLRHRIRFLENTALKKEVKNMGFE